MHDCVLIAMAKLGYDLGLPSLDRGYTSEEIAKALLPTHGLTVYGSMEEIELPHPPEEYIEERYRKKLRWLLNKIPYRVVVCEPAKPTDLEPWCDCLVETRRHALAFVKGVYYNGDVAVNRPDQILSLWVPTVLISNQ